MRDLFARALLLACAFVFLASAAPAAAKKPEPVATFSPTTLALGDGLVGASTPPRTLTLANTGDAPLAIRKLDLNGRDFSLEANACGAALAPGATCTLSIALRPTRAGAARGELRLQADDRGRPQTVELRGTGVTTVPPPVITAPAGGATVTSTLPSAAAEAVTVTGTEGLAGATITLRDGTTAVGTATTGLDNTFSVTLPLRHGAHALSAVAQVGATASASSTTVAVTVVPAPPTLAPVPTAPGANRVAATGAAVPGATVSIRKGSALVATATAGADGAYSATFALPYGQHTLSATQTAGGATSAASPLAGVWLRVPAPSLSSVANDAGTNVVVASGTGLPGAELSLLAGTTTTASAAADAAGRFEATFTLTPGPHAVSARQSVDGEASEPSPALSVTIVPPLPPAGLTAAARSPSTIELSWTGSRNAERYEIAVSTSPANGFTSAGQTTGTSFTASPLWHSTTHYFRVTAVGSGGVSEPALASQATPAPLRIDTDRSNIWWWGFGVAPLRWGHVDTPYSFTVLSAGGIGPHTWSIEGGGLPAGLSLDPATGTIRGTPTTVGVSSFVLQVRDASVPVQAAGLTMELTVNTPLTLTVSVPQVPIERGVPFSATIGRFTGGTGPYRIGWERGSNFPEGFLLEEGPTGSVNLVWRPGPYPPPPGSYTFHLSVADTGIGLPYSMQQVVTTMTVRIVPALEITTTELPIAVGGRWYAQPLSFTGGEGGVTSWSAAGLSQLPPGLTLNAQGELVGVVGFVHEPTTYRFTVQVRQGSLTAERSLSLPVAVQLCVERIYGCDDNTIYTPLMNLGVTGQRFAHAVLVTGGTAPYTARVTSGSLPPGVALCPGSEGCPADVTAPTLMGFFNAGGQYTATLEVADAGPPTQRVTHTFSWKVTPAVRILTEQINADGCGSQFWYLMSWVYIGDPYQLPGTEKCGTTQIRVTGGSGAPGLYRYAVTEGRLPTGLCLQTSTQGGMSCPLGDAGTISGTPDADEDETFKVTVTDTFTGLSDSRTYRIKTRPPHGPLISKLVLTTTSLPLAAHMRPYSARLVAEGGRGPYTWYLHRDSGGLPLGLTLSSDGVISGQPFESGWTWEFDVQVRDSEGQEDSMVLRLPVYCDSLLCWGSPDLSPPETDG